ncbi:MAG TPA: type II toxin-antitoxin system RelE/ParE family toxin [Thermoanaerobaculia bacterium]|nr:type II toxin-antitoxin system RelE/ParE family toxin [Thermoanaerobaculia bacterium]
MREARDAARSLRQFANRGRVVPEIGDPSVRELLVFRQRYRMIYRVLEREVQILAFIHGARDLLVALKEQ